MSINPTYTGMELRRIVRDPVGLFFTAALPAFLFVIFGATQSFKDESAGNGNVGLYIMVSMSFKTTSEIASSTVAYSSSDQPPTTSLASA